MRLIPARAWFFALLSAFLQILPFPIAGPVPLWRSVFCWFALTPLLISILQKDRKGKRLSTLQAALLGYTCGIVWYLANCSWIYQTMYLYGDLPKPIALGILLLFSLYLGLYHAAFTASIAWMNSSRAGLGLALFCAPFFWVAIELARSRITGFPWDLLGYAQVDNLLVTRLAPIAGVMSISFLIVTVSASFAASALLAGNKRIALPCAAALLVFSLQGIGPRFSARRNNTSPFTGLAVLMQENLSVGAAARQEAPISPQQEADQFSKWSSNPLRPLPQSDGTIAWLPGLERQRPTVIVWPEAPSHLQSNDLSLRSSLAELARQRNAPLIVGSLGVDLNPTPSRGYYLYDSAVLIDQAGIYQGRYDKIHLVPWGEYIPFKSFFSFAQKLTEGVGDMDRGQKRSIFPIDGHNYGVFICYESIFGDEVRHFVRNGADVLVNISDDGWYGDTGAPWQHLNMARMRAIENHRWVLRSTNTGITTAIDPQGRVILEAPRHVRAAFLFPFGFFNDRTFYTMHGDWFAILCVLFTVAALLSIFFRRSPLRPML